MRIIPDVKVTRYEKLQPGELFLYVDQGVNFYAIKCAKNKDGDPEEMVVLGPTFPYQSEEAFILPWQAASVVSYGKDYSLMLPTDPVAWHTRTNIRKPVCLAVTEDSAFVCANGGKSPTMHFTCYVDLKTGKIVERQLAATPLYTHDWEIHVPGADGKLVCLVTYSSNDER